MSINESVLPDDSLRGADDLGNLGGGLVQHLWSLVESMVLGNHTARVCTASEITNWFVCTATKLQNFITLRHKQQLHPLSFYKTGKSLHKPSWCSQHFWKSLKLQNNHLFWFKDKKLLSRRSTFLNITLCIEGINRSFVVLPATSILLLNLNHSIIQFKIFSLPAIWYRLLLTIFRATNKWLIILQTPLWKAEKFSSYFFGNLWIL